MSAHTQAVVAIGIALASLVLNGVILWSLRNARRRLSRASGSGSSAPGAESASLGENFFGDADAQTQWTAYLAEFRRDAEARFAQYGLTPGDAHLLYMLNRIRNAITELSTDPDEDAPWRA